MANTYTQLYVHVVIVVRGRANLVSPRWEESLYKYITGIISHKNQKLMAINGMPDHIHLLIGFKPDCNLSDLVRDVKANASKWINENNLLAGRFEWQKGFGAFTVSQYESKNVVRYILNQKEHHKKWTFRTEYLEFLKKYAIDYKEEYLFEDPTEGLPFES